MNVIRSELNGRLERLRTNLLAMTELVAQRVDEVTAALLERDVAKADELVIGDDEIDLMAQEVEELCVDTLIREQPVAGDLRAIVAAMHMNSDIERSGDLTTNIAKAVGRMQGSRPPDRIRDLIVRMAEQAKFLFEQAGEAYRALDPEMAASIDDLDDVLDDLHRTYVEVVIGASRHGELEAHETLQLALIGRFYERIGDHAENMGERTRYIISGWTPESAGADRARARSRGEQVEEPALHTARGLAVIDSIAEERRIDATRRDFVANVSNELKTPIGAISLLAGALADADPDVDRNRLSRHLNREVKRVEGIIDDLLELTRLEEFDPEMSTVSIDDVVHESVDSARGLADASGIELAVVGAPSGVEIQADRRQLIRALVNLIDNAVRYSEPDSQVTVTIDPVQDAVDIRVTDNGIGIARPELERIFERFYRVDRARSRETGGTGLGLSIVRHV
ncbi:MAG: phosphate signaling complex protein PhoU, partial [Actinomycetia bacterium]|nr:phosphate signaling complex protein PhoU [Actinomycetes bacterium]